MNFRSKYRVFFFLICIQNIALSQQNNSPLLPILSIQTHGMEIVDEPKIDATLAVYPSGDQNKPPANIYPVGIEIRGQTSRLYNKKKQYGLETRKKDGTNLNISLLGLPEENDWVLSAPYDDKTLIRDVLCYNLYAQMGRYAPRSRFCIVYINNDYQGIYVLSEKIKFGKNRINRKKRRFFTFLIETSDRNKRKPDESFFTTSYSNKLQLFKYPKKPTPADSIRAKQIFDVFEETLFSKDFPTGALSAIDSILILPDLIDYILLNESVKNVDAFHASTFWHYQKGKKISIGPPWDCNISLGNTNNGDAWKHEGIWVLGQGYPKQLYKNDGFRQNIQSRWNELREGVFSPDNVLHLIDSLTNSIRTEVPANFEKWSILGKYVWPNHFIGKTYDDEVLYLKNWFINRLNWLDFYFGRTPFFVESVFIDQMPARIKIHHNTASWEIIKMDAAGSAATPQRLSGADSIFVLKEMIHKQPALFCVTVMNDSLPVRSQKTFAFVPANGP